MGGIVYCLEGSGNFVCVFFFPLKFCCCIAKKTQSGRRRKKAIDRSGNTVKGGGGERQIRHSARY